MNLIKDYTVCVILLTLIFIGQLDPTTALQPQLIQMYAGATFWKAAILLLILARSLEFTFRGVSVGDIANGVFQKLNSKAQFKSSKKLSHRKAWK